MWYLYKVTNKLNGRYYVGVHKSDNIETDPYMGSGRAIRRAIMKYGISNFYREILAEFDCEELAYFAESEIVDSYFVNMSETYNMTAGGKGGWSHVDSKGDNNWMRYRSADDKKKHSKSVSESRKSSERCRKSSIENFKKASAARTGSKDSVETIEKRKMSLRQFYEQNDSVLKGIKFKETHKKALSDAWTPEMRLRQAERGRSSMSFIMSRLGVTLSCETKELQSASAKARWNKLPRIMIQCPHCLKEGVSHAMKRWHFDKCKQKKD